ncbi:MAG: sulfatase-like hydrolase/transferase, partial [Planctomycetota bacterium]
VAIACITVATTHAAPPNVLIITVDDMSADSLGVYGCKLPDTSPNIDQFARQSLRFQHGHVLVGNCMPGRNIMWSGMYSHANGVEGFRQNPSPDYPVLCDLAKDAGYFTAIRGKVSHSTPYHPYAWDAVLDTSTDGKKYHIKDAAGYGASTRTAFATAKDASKPLCLMVNISDPHKPFYAEGKGGVTIPDPHVPTRVFTPDEVPVPGFLPDDPVVRKELSHYYSSVRRADDCFAAVMTALEESGQAENTFVLFLSDHGMPLPFAKTQLYHHSTRTPLMIRWPGVTTSDSIDDRHVVSSVDLIPTLLEVMQAKHPTPERLHGRSFAALLQGESQQGRDFAILQYNENAGRNRHPMRGITTRDRLYLYNPWSDGKRNFATATDGTSTYKRMVQMAKENDAVADRVQLIDHRVMEEYFDIENDPDCLDNLIDDPKYAAEIARLRQQLAESLAAMDDPVAPLVAAIDDDALRHRYMQAEDEKTAQFREKSRKQQQIAKQRKSKAQASRKANRDLVKALSLTVPQTATAGQVCQIQVRYELAKQLPPQKLHVTLKTAKPSLPNKPLIAGKRVHREVIKISTQGETSIAFNVPTDVTADALVFAAFIGEDYTTHLEHQHSDVIALER